MCYNPLWLLIEIIDRVAGATLAEKGKCLRQPAATAAKNVKFPLNPQEANLFIAETVLEPWEEAHFQGGTIEAHQGQILTIATGDRPILNIKNNLKRLMSSLIKS
mgnify:CR=1 FL=1